MSKKLLLHPRLRESPHDTQGDIVDADDFAAIDVDDLLVEQVVREKQVEVVGVIGGEVVVGERDAVGGDRGDLIETNLESGTAVAE